MYPTPVSKVATGGDSNLRSVNILGVRVDDVTYAEALGILGDAIRTQVPHVVTTLGSLDAGSIDMKCLLIVGASTTRRTASGQVWTPRFVSE